MCIVSVSGCGAGGEGGWTVELSDVVGSVEVGSISVSWSSVWRR